MKLQIVWTALGIVLLILLQVEVFNYIQLFRYATPSVYLFALLLFNVDTPSVWLTLAGAVIGLAIDLLSGTPGLHMSALTLVGFLRNYLLAPVVDIESNLHRPPSMRIHGWGVWLAILEMVAIHQFVLFTLDSLGGFDIGYYFLRMGSSLLLTYLIVMILQMLFLERTPRRQS
jgi:rod shape-determining protein mreD